MKNILFFFGIVLIVLVVIFTLLANQGKPAVGSKSTKIEGMILFYSTTCPHCKRVEAFIKQNKIEEKVKFQRVEINSSPQNTNLFVEKSTVCKIPQEQMGVPLFWDGSKCVFGDQPIIDYFKIKMK